MAKNANIDVFRELLVKLHPKLKSTVEKRKKNSCEQTFNTFVKVLNFLDLSRLFYTKTVG